MDSIDEKTAYEISRTFPVAQTVLFNAFVDASTLKTIWGLSSIAVDARSEGHARAEWTIGEENWNFTISYREVVPYDRLRWVVHFDRSQSKETRVTLLFRTVEDASEVTLRMENFETTQERDGNRQAWNEALDRLGGIVHPQ